MNLDRTLAVIGLIGTFGGIPLAIFLALKYRTKPIVRWASQFTVLVRPHQSISQEESLELRYRGVEVENLTRTAIAFWHSSGNTIRGTDIAEQDPLRVQVPEGDRILQVRGISRSRLQNKVKFVRSDDGTSATITFDFLDASDGYIFEVLHSGDDPAELTGTLRGVTVQDRGRAPLDPASLDMAATRAATRPFHFSTMKTPRSRRGKGFVLLFLLLFIGGLGWLADTVFDNVGAKASLVDASDYDLGTRAGQLDFSQAVDEASAIGYSTAIALGALLLVMLGVVVLIIRDNYRAVVPRSILHERRPA